MLKPLTPIVMSILAALTVSVVAVVPVALAWTQRYTGPIDSNDIPAGLIIDGSGNAVVTGSSIGATENWDYYTAKYAAGDGSLLWHQRYNSSFDTDDVAAAIAIDGSGNVVVTGSSIGATGNWDYYTAKYAAGDGSLLWQRRYNSSLDTDDVAAAIATDGSGNVVVTGSSIGATGSWDYHTVKYAAGDGSLVWQQGYNGPLDSNDIAVRVATDNASNVVVTGRSIGATGNWDYYTAKYAGGNGSLLWQQRYNGPLDSNDFTAGMVTDSLGNVVVTGSSIGVTGNWDYYTAKYAASDGHLLWHQRYNSSIDSNDIAVGVATDSAGDVMVTGRSIGTMANWDCYTAKYAGLDGHLVWSYRHNGAIDSDDYPTSLAVDHRGNVAVTGRTSKIGGRWDHFTDKYAATDGHLLWTRVHAGSLDSDDIGRRLRSLDSDDIRPHPRSLDSDDSRRSGPFIASNPAGSVVLTGSNTVCNGPDYLTLRFVDGLEKWRFENFFDGLGNSAVSGGLADPDGDGIQNVLEYSLGGDPSVSAAGVSPQANTSGGRLTLQFQRDTRNHDLDYTVQVSSALGTWMDLASGIDGGALVPIISGTTVTETGAGFVRTVLVRDAVDISAAPRRFMRLKVSH